MQFTEFLLYLSTFLFTVINGLTTDLTALIKPHLLVHLALHKLYYQNLQNDHLKSYQSKYQTANADRVINVLFINLFSYNSIENLDS